MSGGGGTNTTTTTQSAEPWSGIQPALGELYSGALQNYFSGGPQYYPGSTVVQQSPNTLNSYSLLQQRALSGSPIVDAAQQQAQQTLGGDYLWNPASQSLYNFSGQNLNIPGSSTLQNIAGGGMLNSNPYLNATFNQAAGRVGEQFRENVMPQVASMFSSAGRYGSGAMQNAVQNAEQEYGDTLSNLATNIYGQNYSQERGLQQQALGQLGSQSLAGMGLQQQALQSAGDMFSRERAMQMGMLGITPQLAQQDYYDINQLGQLGSMQEAYQQQLLNDQINRYSFNQQRPSQNLQTLSQLLQGGLNFNTQTGSTTTPYQTNPMLGALGGGMMGQQVGTALDPGWGTWGSALGAIYGGLFG